MKNHEYYKGPEVKICEAKNKQDEKCGKPFSKPHNMKPHNWAICTNCPECRARKASHRDRQDHHGGHTIHPLIDQFLRGSIS